MVCHGEITWTSFRCSCPFLYLPLLENSLFFSFTPLVNELSFMTYEVAILSSYFEFPLDCTLFSQEPGGVVPYTVTLCHRFVCGSRGSLVVQKFGSFTQITKVWWRRNKCVSFYRRHRRSRPQNFQLIKSISLMYNLEICEGLIARELSRSTGGFFSFKYL